MEAVKGRSPMNTIIKVTMERGAYMPNWDMRMSSYDR